MTGYPWAAGDALLADDLNAAIAGMTVPAGGSIQAAVDALPSTGGVVNLSANAIYTQTSTLRITKPNVSIQAPGWNTIIRRTVGMTGHLVEASGAGFVIRNVTVDGNGPANTAGNFEVDVYGANSLIEHCQIINAGAQGHVVLSGDGSRAEGNVIRGLGSPTQGGYGIWAIQGDKVFIINNRISGTAVDGIGFNGNGTQIIGNHVSGCQCYASASTTGGGQIAQYHPNTDGAIIANNYVDQGGGTLSSGLELWGLNLTVVGNVVVNQVVQGVAIGFISGGRPGLLLEANTILNNGRGSAAAFGLSGLSLFGPLNNVNIIGNRIADTQTTHTQQWGVYIDPGSTNNNLLIANNDLTGNVLGGLSYNGAGTGNVVVNNIGAANTPGVPTVNAASDAAAASAGVAVGGEYRNGSVKMVRVA